MTFDEIRELAIEEQLAKMRSEVHSAANRGEVAVVLSSLHDHVSPEAAERLRGDGFDVTPAVGYVVSWREPRPVEPLAADDG